MTMPLPEQRDKTSRGARRRQVLNCGARACLFVVLLAPVMPGIANPGPQEPIEGRAHDNGRLKQEEIEAAERRLAELGYWAGKIDGEFDSASRHALLAFQKAEGRPRSGSLTRAEYAAMLLAGPPLPQEGGYAHVEVDLRRQIMFRVDGAGTVSHILPISSGNGESFTSEGYTRRAVTPAGRFAVYHKINGWRRSPLGLLYYPNYILGGIAIHGSPSVPARPASHGCIRIPMFAAEEFSRLTPIGTIVLVYDDTPASDHP